MGAGKHGPTSWPMAPNSATRCPVPQYDTQLGDMAPDAAKARSAPGLERVQSAWIGPSVMGGALTGFNWSDASLKSTDQGNESIASTGEPMIARSVTA